MKNITLKILLIIFIITTITLGGYIIYDKLIPTKYTTTKNTPTKEPEKLELNNYLGYWYESEHHFANPNANNINIKNIENNTLLMDLYFTRTAHFYNFNVTLTENRGTFTSNSDDGPSTDGNPSQINGNITISNNTIKLTILESNIRDIEKGKEYTFTYHKENSNITNYQGNWFESEQHTTDLNPNTLTIKEINNNKITFNLYITRTAEFKNINVYISDTWGKFEAFTDTGPSTDNNPARITGDIQLSNNTIKIIVDESNVLYLNTGTEYTFTYKK